MSLQGATPLSAADQRLNGLDLSEGRTTLMAGLFSNLLKCTGHSVTCFSKQLSSQEACAPTYLHTIMIIVCMMYEENNWMEMCQGGATPCLYMVVCCMPPFPTSCYSYHVQGVPFPLTVIFPMHNYTHSYMFTFHAHMYLLAGTQSR